MIGRRFVILISFALFRPPSPVNSLLARAAQVFCNRLRVDKFSWSRPSDSDDQNELPHQERLLATKERFEMQRERPKRSRRPLPRRNFAAKRWQVQFTHKLEREPQRP